jgi:hypothetical protein
VDNRNADRPDTVRAHGPYPAGPTAAARRVILTSGLALSWAGPSKQLIWLGKMGICHRIHRGHGRAVVVPMPARATM